MTDKELFEYLHWTYKDCNGQRDRILVRVRRTLGWDEMTVSREYDRMGLIML